MKPKKLPDRLVRSVKPLATATAEWEIPPSKPPRKNPHPLDLPLDQAIVQFCVETQHPMNRFDHPDYLANFFPGQVPPISIQELRIQANLPAIRPEYYEHAGEDFDIITLVEELAIDYDQFTDEDLANMRFILQIPPQEVRDARLQVNPYAHDLDASFYEKEHPVTQAAYDQREAERLARWRQESAYMRANGITDTSGMTEDDFNDPNFWIDL